MSFLQLFRTHMLSLEFVWGFCHRIAKGRDRKVEFIQLFCWLYSVPNLLVIQHLETLYLGGNHVKVCERVWRKAQGWHSRRASRLASRQRWHTCEACKESWRVMPTVALQNKTSRMARQLARDSFQLRARVTRMPYLVVTNSSHSTYTLL